MTIDRKNPAPTQFHPSFFEGYSYVYPAVSRRANGVSLGVNLSPTKLCNFRCVYCQVGRSETSAAIERAVAAVDPAVAASYDVLDLSRSSCVGAPLDLDLLRYEIKRLAQATLSRELFLHPRFSKVDASRQVLRDFAFSGDGEPTLSRQFPQVVDLLAEVRRELRYDPLKLVLITNATRLQAPTIVDALDRFSVANGEIWTKLDAGDNERLKLVNRTAVPLNSIVDNIACAAKRWRVKIQTVLFCWRGSVPSDDEFMRYCERVGEILQRGGEVCSIQLYTVARTPVESEASPLPNEAMDRYASILRRETGQQVETYYST